MVGNMSKNKYVTVSAKIKVDLWRKIKEYNINASEVIRKAIETEISKIEEEKLVKELEEAGKALSIHSDEEIVQLIRSTREER